MLHILPFLSYLLRKGIQNLVVTCLIEFVHSIFSFFKGKKIIACIEHVNEVLGS